ncbi:MAG: thiamine biosynthesis protein ThiS [Deltaproteobacteria bacterium]|nr:MAG: thiamine biosynthesis protein ThiS [Deltaproteobacteria bacterium]
MKIRVNGAEETVASGITVGAYLAARDVDPAHVVVELNGEILSADAREGQVLTDADRMEIVTFVGGG